MPRRITRRLEFTPEFREFDMMGVAHNAAYFNWFERGRFQILNDIMPMSESLRNKLAVVVLENRCKYVESIRYEEPILLITRHKIDDFYTGRLEFEHELSGLNTKRLHATGFCMCSIINTDTGALAREFPQELWQKYSSLK